MDALLLSETVTNEHPADAMELRIWKKAVTTRLLDLSRSVRTPLGLLS